MGKVTSLWSRFGEVASLVATPLLPSHYVALVRPLLATHTRHARVEAVHDEAPGVRTLTLRPGRGWRAHRPGQHVRVGLAIAGKIATRTYSITSPPGRRDGCITITVKAHRHGRVSRALVHDTVVGTFVTLGLPEGAFVLPEGAPVRPLFVTAGSGITPVACMLRAFDSAVPDTVHVHYVRNAADMIFGAELRALATAHRAYRLIVIDTAVEPRRFDGEQLDALVPDWRERQAWACGPQGLLDALAHTFEREGRELHVERFSASLAALPASAQGGRVRFTASGVAAAADGRTPLLRVAEAAGLAPAHGCRMGICHSCDAALLAGCVRDLRTGTSIDEPGARIQICVCAAAGDVELDL